MTTLQLLIVLYIFFVAVTVACAVWTVAGIVDSFTKASSCPPAGVGVLSTVATFLSFRVVQGIAALHGTLSSMGWQ